MNRMLLALAMPVFLHVANVHAQHDPISDILNQPIIGESQSWHEVQAFVEARVVPFPDIQNASDWQSYAQQLRRDVKEQLVFRGEAKFWRDAKTQVEWLETIPGGPGYVIKKLRFEAVPGMWVPALLYEPDELTGNVPVVMNVNGHALVEGKAAEYKQIRCINQAKRGMLALNVEWLGTGQLNSEGFNHYKMNQLDLCGTSGLAPFYLAMSRGLDVLLAHEHADPSRVAVAGLSGGGWQTIFISSLDTRVTLANPVAGYSSFLTRVRHPKDLGDSEQTPSDLATLVDYTHLTALLAPRPAMLTFNSKDNCCFESGYALPPLLAAAEPVYAMLDADENLAHHVNDDPGDHNFGQENREALYRMFSTHFGSDSSDPLPEQEIDCQAELKTKAELTVELPTTNADFHTLAMNIMQSLPETAGPSSKQDVSVWQSQQRDRLAELVRADRDATIVTQQAFVETSDDLQAIGWRLRVADLWTVPAVELWRGQPHATKIVVADAGRQNSVSQIMELVDLGNRVIAVDPFLLGESKIQVRDFLYAIQVATVGQRPLGVQASQVAAVARWLKNNRGLNDVSVTSLGPRTSLIGMVAAAMEPAAINSIVVYDAYGSLKQVIEADGSVDQTPELFCFGLLKEFDVRQIAELIAPREIRFANASDRARAELADLRTAYSRFGKTFDPLQ